MTDREPAKRRTAEVIELRAKSNFAIFTIDQQPERRYYGLSIWSSFGGFAYAWSHPGCEFYKFLADLDRSYVLGKMVGRDDEFDGEATTKAVRQAILERRRTRECEAGEAREEWPEYEFDSDSDFNDWMANTQMFRDEDPWDFRQTRDGPRSQDFIALYDLFWADFAKELTDTRKEIQP